MNVSASYVHCTFNVRAKTANGTRINVCDRGKQRTGVITRKINGAEHYDTQNRLPFLPTYPQAIYIQCTGKNIKWCKNNYCDTGKQRTGAITRKISGPEHYDTQNRRHNFESQQV